MKINLAVGLGLLCAAAQAAPLFPQDREVVYASIGEKGVKLHLFEPVGLKAGDNRPAIVFFFGGGWNDGGYQHFSSHSRHLADKGMVAICVTYRTKTSDGVNPFECVKDAKASMRYVRAHAKELGIDPNRIIAGGGSAGGHLAVATATLDSFNHDFDDLSVSCRPNALVLFNPVYDNGPKGYGYERVKGRWKEFSPMENIHKDMPPTIVFLGTKDGLIPVSTAKAFQKKMQDLGIRSELSLYEDQKHGFFNYGKGDNPNYPRTIEEMDDFLLSLGYIQK